jgi:beta-glucosidase
VKHFAAYGAAEGGRDYDSVYVPEGLLRNVYLPPFHAAVKAGAGSLMSAYMDLNDVPAVANRFLLRDVLRKEWGFSGFVVSDAFAVGNLLIQGFARDGRDAAERAFLAGVNMDMASRTFPEHLPGLLRDGRITMAQIDEAVRPLLAAKLRLGLFEHPYSDEARAKAVLGAPEHRQEARLAAQRSLVLLRNEGGLLPLKKTLSSVAVIGPLADSKYATEGGWMVFGHVSAAVTVREGIRAKLGDAARVEYAKGPDIKRDIPTFFDEILGGPPKSTQTPAEADVAFADAVKTAQKAEAVVMVLGEESNMSGEAASRASLHLPGRQEELLKAVMATGKPVVLVLLAGRPLSIPWAAANVPAILEAWQPGSEGGHAVADALFGDVNPGGKLPVTFPRSAGYSPFYYAHNLTFQPEGSPRYQSRYWDGPTTPVYPFGFGLSYTSFAFSNLKTELPRVKVGGTVAVSVEVTNRGPVAGDEVAQLYIHQKAGSDSRPIRELKGFERIALKPGETKTVRFRLGPEELGYWSTSNGKWIQEAAAFDLWAGGDSTASLHADLTITP